MIKRRGPITAAELMAKLQSDPAYLKRQREQERIREERAAVWQASEAPLLAALRGVGIDIDTVWGLVSSTAPYDRAIPILFEHLQKSYPDKVREGIARALAVPQANVGWPLLVAQFKREVSTPSNAVKNGLAVAIAAAAREQNIEDLIRLIKEGEHDDSRLLLLLGLKRIKSQQVKDALKELATDPQLSREIRSWRRK